MNIEDYVSYEVAKLLKEKGYHPNYQEDYWIIDDNQKIYFISAIGAYDFVDNPGRYERPKVHYPLPTLRDAAKWLREGCNIAVCIHPYDFKWDYTIFDLKNTYDNDDNHKIIASQGLYSTYEEALNEGIKEALKLI